ncbi:MAG: UDP-N-acetylmuramoyl-L-alanyl-D-glutamate--2,6-diaminopimelate ligase [Saprospiraceae bacterium]|nr:UDP-N-acetylmuramoyl-L-alanyl-D-glutamate--2,6-diaminopimelate ligase [Saprospiraceae bacterium]
MFDILPVKFKAELHGSDEVVINGIETDSRKVEEGFVYAALRGTIHDGHDYLNAAVENGAKVVICELRSEMVPGVTYIITDDVRSYLGELTHNYYGQASANLKLVGVTGTNGKTTVSTLLFQLFSSVGYKCGLISTVENRIGQEVIPASHTTPDVINLHKLLSEMRDENCAYVFMEVSSHAIDQQRIAGLRFVGALFTNITHDHLDYHKTMLHYIGTKKKFFDLLSVDAFALVNTDDSNGAVMLQNTKAKRRTYGLRSMADYKTKILESSVEGLHLKINDRDAFFRLIGEFNAYNLTAVYGAAIELGLERDDVLAILSGLKGAEGRFEQIINKPTGKCGIVDYAHTPDALKNVLDTIRKIKKSTAGIITVVGCGGDRDRTKRPVMAKVACELSDKVILTSDNPRWEDPEHILNEMESGVDPKDKIKMIRISDRMQAIKAAVMMSKNGDIILVAGKGHENYQEIKGEKFPFNDKILLMDLLG